MALTLDVEQRLEAVELIGFFNENRDAWTAIAKDTYEFVRKHFPEGSKIRHDDVAKALRPVVEVDENLQDALHEKRLSQKYWVTFFTDLVIDRTWNEITTKRSGQR